MQMPKSLATSLGSRPCSVTICTAPALNASSYRGGGAPFFFVFASIVLPLSFPFYDCLFCPSIRVWGHAHKQDGYSALSAHYGFEAVFCNPASGNEKGLVEDLVGYIRRNACVPIPKAETMDELNRMLLKKCKSYLSHQIRGKPASVGEMLAQMQRELYPLPGYPFDPCKHTSGRVDRFCTVRFDTNIYSVPAAYCGKEVSIKAGPEMVWIYYQGKCISQHQRCLDRRQAIYKLEHYLPLLEKKGRAIFYAKPVQDALPGYFLNWLQKQRLSPKELVELLRRCQEEGCDAMMSQSPCHASSAQIHDTVVVQEVDLHLYDAFLYGKVSTAV